MCTPFEVEWQCVHLEQHNFVDGVMSINDDCAVLGVKKIKFKRYFQF